MTDDEWNQTMLAKLDEWLANPHGRKPLLKHMMMNAEGFIHWRETGQVAKSTRLCWVVFDDEIFDRIWGQRV